MDGEGMGQQVMLAKYYTLLEFQCRRRFGTGQPLLPRSFGQMPTAERMRGNKPTHGAGSIKAARSDLTATYPAQDTKRDAQRR